MPGSRKIRAGIIPALQTPFDGRADVDFSGVRRLVRAATEGGAAGLLAPVVASEVEYLSAKERAELVRVIAEENSGRLPLVVGASSSDPEVCRANGRLAVEVGASAWLVAVPPGLYPKPRAIPGFFERASRGVDLPLLIQDMDFSGQGLSLEAIVGLKKALPSLVGIKIETAPSGPKFTEVREACGPEFFIAGGWTIPQMIEALDRGVDGMIPEASMVAVYSRIEAAYRQGDRASALGQFRRLSPVLAFSNQELAISVAFFKRLLVRRGVFSTEATRIPFEWDPFRLRIADELIDYYLALEAEMLAGD